MGEETNKIRIRELLDMDRLGQLYMGSKSIELGSTWSQEFLHKMLNKIKQGNISTHKKSSQRKNSNSQDGGC